MNAIKDRLIQLALLEARRLSDEHEQEIHKLHFRKLESFGGGIVIIHKYDHPMAEVFPCRRRRVRDRKTQQIRYATKGKFRFHPEWPKFVERWRKIGLDLITMELTNEIIKEVTSD